MDDQTPPPAGTTREEQRPGADDTTDRHGPRVTREQVLDTQRLRRSTSDRYVAGVAGGLARHLDVDPLLVRIVLAVLTLFGAAGLVVYVAVWLLVPADDRDRAPVPLRAETLKVVLLGVLAVAALLVLGLPWGDPAWFFWTPWPLLLLLAGGLWLATRNRSAAPPPPPGAPTGEGPAPAARPRRTGVVLFWPTLALVAIALGVVGLVDVSYDVPVAAYAAAALAVTALALLLGAFRGRPGGLIALGLLLSVVLAGAATADAVRAFGPYGQTEVTPVSVADLEAADASYGGSGGTVTLLPDSGDFTLDLRQVRDLDALDGRTIAVQMDLGELSVVLPRGLNAAVEGEIRYAGEVSLPQQVLVSGVGSRSGSDTVGSDPDDPTVRLDLVLGTGQVDVTR